MKGTTLCPWQAPDAIPLPLLLRAQSYLDQLLSYITTPLANPSAQDQEVETLDDATTMFLLQNDKDSQHKISKKGKEKFKEELSATRTTSDF